MTPRRRRKKHPTEHFLTISLLVFWSVALFVVLLRLFPNK